MHSNKDFSDLEWMLGYELSSSSRHRRFVSLVMVSSTDSRDELERILEGAVRDSDISFSMDDGTIVLMGETDTHGALRAVERFQNTIHGTVDVRFSVSSYPTDGKIPAELLDAAHRRLKLARALSSGAVVVEG